MPSKKGKDKDKDKDKEQKKSPSQEQALREQISGAKAAARSASSEILAKFEEQVKTLSELAEQYLDQGLLGHHCEAVQLRDRALQTLKDTREKLGVPPESPSASSPKSSSSKPVREKGGASPAGGAAGAGAGAGAIGKPAKTGPGGGTAAAKAEAEEAPAPEDNLQPWSTTACLDTRGAPLYRWRQLPRGGAILQIAHSAGGSGETADDEPEVDLSEGAVRLAWRAAGRALTLPLGFCADVGRCRAVRRRWAGLRVLELRLPSRQPRPPPGKPLTSAVSGLEGWGVADGFLTGGEAEELRQHLLDLWCGGKFLPGDVEGGDRANAAHAGACAGGSEGPSLVRSDEHLYPEESGPVLAFARRLDRVVLGLASEVPALAKRRLMRGRPMAAVYAGSGSRYAPHFDAIGGDNGRVLTCILYLNPFWREGDGAVLRLWPFATRLVREGPCREVAPLHGRLAAFLCDGRNLHEVSPVAAGREVEPRLALSCWYYDAEAIERVSDTSRAEDTPKVSA